MSSASTIQSVCRRVDRGTAMTDNHPGLVTAPLFLGEIALIAWMLDDRFSQLSPYGKTFTLMLAMIGGVACLFTLAYLVTRRDPPFAENPEKKVQNELQALSRRIS